MSIENAEYVAVGKQLERPHEQRRATGHIEVYANNAQITATYFDFQVVFGEILEASKEKLVTEDSVTIKMSPQLAKRLSEILQTHIGKYETMYGAIPQADRAADKQEFEPAQS